MNTTHLTIRIIRNVPLNLGYLLGKLEFLNIASMNIFKLYDNKKALYISFTERVDDENLPFIEEVIKSSFDMSKTTRSATPIIKKENIKVNCNHTAHLASMSIVAKDQKGLFAYIAKIFDDFNIEIESAKLHTIKGYAKDLLLIEKNGNFCGNQDDIIDLMCTDDKIEKAD
jgi:[protein-PII] uridylyltransferase